MIILKNIRNSKNIIFTSGLTFLLGLYSIYHLFIFIKQMDNKINNLKNEENNKNKLEFEIIKINNEISSILYKLQKLENQYSSLDKVIGENQIQSDNIDIGDEKYIEEIELNNNCKINNEDKNNKNETTSLNPQKNDEFTCITLEECSETDSIKSTSSSNYKPRSRSSSLSWGAIKTIFG